MHSVEIPHAHTVVRIVTNGPGYSIVESDCGGSMADGRIFDSYTQAKGFAQGYRWVVDERTQNQDVIV